MQPSKENVAICVSFSPLIKYQILTVIFQVTPYFIMTYIEINKFRDSVDKTNENQDFRKGNTCT